MATGKNYVLSKIRDLSEDDSMSMLITDTKQFKSLDAVSEKQSVILEGHVEKIEKPNQAAYPYYIIKVNEVKAINSPKKRSLMSDTGQVKY